MKNVFGILVLALGLTSCSADSKHSQGDCLSIVGKPMVARIDKILYEKTGKISYTPSVYLLTVALVAGENVLPLGQQAAEVAGLDKEPSVQATECPAGLN